MTPEAEGGQNLAATPMGTPDPKDLDQAPPDLALDTSQHKSSPLIPFLKLHLWPSQYPRLQFIALICQFTILLGCIVNALAPLTLGALITTFNNPNIVPFPPYGSSPWPYLVTYLVLTLLSSSGLAALRHALWIPIMQYSDRTMSMRVFNHILALSLGWHTKRKTSELLYILGRVTAVNRLGELIYFTVLPVLLNVAVAVVVFMIRFELALGVVVGAAMVGYIWASVMLMKYRTKERRQMDDQDATVRAIHTDTLFNHETVKYFGGEEHEARRYADAVGQYQSFEKNFYLALDLHILAQTLIVTFGLLAGSVIVSSRIRRGESGTSDFVVFITYYTQLFFPLSQIGDVYRSVDQGLIDAEKLSNLLAEPIEVVDAPDAKELIVENGEIEFDNVSFSYDGTTPALKNVSFKVPPGGRVVLVGESGAGKSTLLRLLYRVYDLHPDKGRILVDGQDIRTVTLSSLRNAIGLLPWDPVLFNASIGYNIAYGQPSMTPPSQSTIIDAARAVGLHECIMNLPEGYKTKVGERGMRLSDRERQAVSIARTIVKNPKVVLLDEVTSGLNGVRRLVDGRSCLRISHQLKTIKATDVIVVLKEGCVVEQGSRKELCELDGLFASMCAGQIKASEETPTYEAPVVDVPEPESRLTLGRQISSPRAVRKEDTGLSFIAPDSGSPGVLWPASDLTPQAFQTTSSTSDPPSVDSMGHPERLNVQGAGVTFDPGAISRPGSPEPGSGRRVAQGIQRLARRISVAGSGSGSGSKGVNTHGHHRETSTVSSGSGGVSVSPPVSVKKSGSVNEESHRVEKPKEEKRKKRKHLL